MNRKWMYIAIAVIAVIMVMKLFGGSSGSSSRTSPPTEYSQNSPNDITGEYNPNSRTNPRNYAQQGARQEALRYHLYKAYQNAEARAPHDRFEPAHLKEAVGQYPKYPIRQVYYLTDGDSVYAFAVYKDNINRKEYEPSDDGALPEFEVAISNKEQAGKMIDFLEANGVVVSTVNLKGSRPQAQQAQQSSGGGFPWFTFFFLGFMIWFFFLRGKMGGQGNDNGRRGGGGGGFGGGLLNHNQSRARRETNVKTRFSDVAGCDQAKEDATEFIKFLQNAENYTAVNAPMPKGILLSGPPGTGKTLIAQAIAGEAGVQFFSISGSDFVEMYVGTGPARMENTFQLAAKNAPAVLFIDEIDAIGQKRGKGGPSSGGNDEREATLNKLLTCMDGFDSSQGVIVIAATNRPELLDPALLDRFTRKIEVELPNEEARTAILKVHMRKHPLDPRDGDQEEIANELAPIIAQKCPGFSGRNIESLTGEAALIAARAGLKGLTLEHFEQAAEKIMKGLTPYDDSIAKMQFNVETRFTDVAGCDAAKEDVEEVISFLKDPEAASRLGGKMPTGTIFVGPPGTGKTLLAKAMAGEANVPFMTVAGSDFSDKFVGEGKEKVKALFAAARRYAPCILFIDEIDAVGGKRGSGNDLGGHAERENTMNQLLVEMDGFEGNEGIVLIAATNRIDMLDPALTRPGRFDRQVEVSMPDAHSREQILKVHMKKVKLAESADKIAPVIALGTPGFSGADLANLVNEAALLAAKLGKDEIDLKDFDDAKDKIVMGAERKTLSMTREEMRKTAYHESGHAIVGKISEPLGHDAVHKVTIAPRGRALGLTWFLPSGDKVSESKQALEAQIATLFGGRLAEVIIYGNDAASTGASNDIERATEIARKMVREWGFVPNSDDTKTAPRHYKMNERTGQLEEISDEEARLIGQYIREFLDRNYAKAREILEVAHRDKLEIMTQALMKYETIDIDMINEIMDGTAYENLTPPKWWTDEHEKAYQKNCQKEACDNECDDDKDE
jgi:cell division protease FtsH